jgi:hypothetical protein
MLEKIISTRQKESLDKDVEEEIRNFTLLELQSHAGDAVSEINMIKQVYYRLF